ncbi:MAG: D-erythro-7,8-dihydroneopterin triphosphate epimerase [Gammaproteobacteria bacterium]|jgi:D-erythro-7,8-dihydroneopterin triphosphate epimerase
MTTIRTIKPFPPRLKPVKGVTGYAPPKNRVRPKLAEITINNLRLRTYAGFNPDEKSKKQDVVINALIQFQTRPGIYQDCVEDALNYKTITKKIIATVEEGRFLLLEKLVSDVLDICAEPDEVTFARIEVDKPHALRFADSVSLTMEYRRDL